MNLKLKEWQRLSAAKDAVVKALGDYESEIANLMMNHSRDRVVRALLNNIRDRIDAATSAIMQHDVRPVSEWVGGDKSKFREPHCVGLPRKYFEEDEKENPRHGQPSANA